MALGSTVAGWFLDRVAGFEVSACPYWFRGQCLAVVGLGIDGVLLSIQQSPNTYDGEVLQSHGKCKHVVYWPFSFLAPPGNKYCVRKVHVCSRSWLRAVL